MPQKLCRLHTPESILSILTSSLPSPAPRSAPSPSHPGPASNPVPRLYLGSSPISLSGRLLWAHMGKENNNSYRPLRCLSLHHTGSLGRSDPHPSLVSPSSFLGGRNCSSQSLSSQHLDGDLPNSKGLISAPGTTQSNSEAGWASRLFYSWEN